LYGKDLNEYDDVDVDTLLAQLSPEEINILAKEVDPDVSKIFYLNFNVF
jgi:tropomodulin